MPYACSQLKFGRIINSVGFSYSTESMFYTYIIVQAEILLKLNKMLTTVTDILKKIGKKPLELVLNIITMMLHAHIKN